MHLSKHVSVLLFFSILCLCLPVGTQAQANFTNTVPSEIAICREAKTFGISFTSTHSSWMNVVRVRVVFPTGLTYVPGSVSGGSATESDISNLGSPVFALPSVPTGGTASFNLQAIAGFAAVASAQSGAVFKNTVALTFTGGSKSAQTAAFNVLYPALTISSAPNASVFVGQTFTRAVSVVNGGFGDLTSFTLTDQFNSSILQLLSVDKGALGSGGVITFSAADFATVGDGDGLFELNETLTVTETIKTNGCSSTQSTLTAKWGCGGSQEESNKKYPTTTITLYAPNLAFTGQPAFNTCISTTGDQQSLRIVNNGTGPAKTPTISITPGATDQYTRIDPASITYQIGTTGTPVSISATATTDASAHACFGVTGAKSGFSVALPDIAPSATVFLKWKTYTCATTACGAVNLIGWKYSASYSNMCASQTYTASGTGQALKKKTFSVFVENPANLSNGQTGEWAFTLNTATLDMPQGASPYLQAEFDLPVGLNWSGNNADLAFRAGSTAWSPTSVSFDGTARRLTARYALSAPFSLSYSEIRIKLAADCSSLGANPVGLGFALYYVMDASCASPHKFSLTCYLSPQTLLHCPGSGCMGMAFDSFTPKRHSTGLPDNDQNGLPDGSGALDLSKILLNRVMASDTFKTTFGGTINTSATYPTWSYAFAKSTMPRSSSITALWAVLSVTDASTGAVKTATLSPYANTTASGNRTVTWNLSPASIGGAFSGFSYENGDQVTLTAFYQLSGNIGTTMEQIAFTNEFYTATALTGGTKFQCNNWLGNLTLVGYQLSNYSSDQYNVESCTKTISQNFGLLLGQSSVRAGMDMFPFECRRWAIIKDLQVTMPSGYSYVSSSMSQTRTLSTSSTATQTVASMVPMSTSGQDLFYDLSSQYTTGGGALIASDDGFNGTVNVEIKPVCSVSTSANQSMPWQFKFKQAANFFGGATSAWVTTTADRVLYKPSVFSFTSSNQLIEAVQPEIAWDVDLKNNSNTPAANSWFFLQSFSNKITVLEVRNRSSNALIAPDGNGFYRLGTVNGNVTTQIRIKAKYTSCSLDELKITMGYSCDAYPVSLAAFACSKQEYSVSYDPQPAQLQVKLRSSQEAGDPCAAGVTVELDLLSSKLSSSDDIEVRLTPPTNGNITLRSGSFKYQYPTSGAYQNFTAPALSGGTYSIFPENIVTSLAANGLPGVGSAPSNLFRVKFTFDLGANYRPGQTVGIQIFSKKPCGSANSATAYDFDPSAAFERKTGIGLDGPLDAWSASWIDYDNDGDQDIFIGTATGTDANALFKNNGNGTFTKITTGVIVTENSKSYASTWADTDNDGDLDVFVSTDISQKKLYFKNNGNGTFTKVTGDPVVDQTASYARGAAFADYDNDGAVDLFVADFFTTKFNLLFHNNGDGSFTKIDDSPISKEAASSIAGVWGDYNGDGLIDLFVANTNNEPNSLYKNLGGGRFEKLASGPIVADGGKSIGASWGDIDNDGDLDLFVANGGGSVSFLYRNMGGDSFSRITAGDLPTTAGNANGSAFVDFDNDGDLDLFVANDQDQNNFLYSNDGTGAFERVAANISQDGGQTMATAWADYDNDGDMDALAVNRSSNELFFYKNGRGQCLSRLCLSLVGTRSNRSAIGAVVRVKATIYGQSIWQMRQISAQSGGGIGGQNDLRASFGLGNATAVDSILVEWPSGYLQKMGGLAIDQCHTITEPNASRVCGKAWLDLDGDCEKDANEPVLPKIRLRVEPGGYRTATDGAGEYELFLADGQHTITAEADAPYSATCSATRSATISGLGQEHCGLDFGLSTTCSQPDLEVEIAGTALRVGFKNLIAVHWRNVGGQKASSLSLRVNFGQHVEPQSASLAWTTAESTSRIWQLPDLELGNSGTIYITALVPSTVALNQLVEINATVSCTDGECSATNNAFRMAERTVGAFDPNDILVSPEGAVRPSQDLTYKIRFQNVGTFSAKQVIVEDFLPEELDLATLEMGTASHPYRLQMSDNGRRLRWIFDNINLADSVSNEPASHGFVTFRVRPRADLAIGETIANVAEIWFDSQAPIRTNTVANSIRSSAQPQAPAPGQLLLMPNPTASAAIALAPDSNEPLESIEIYDLHGRLLQKSANRDRLREVEIDVADWPQGVYLLRAADASGRAWTGRLVVLR